MAILTIRNVPADVHRALRLRAAGHGRSTEAEVREILAHAVQPALGMGDALAEISRQAGLTDADISAVQRRRKTPAVPLRLK